MSEDLQEKKEGGAVRDSLLVVGGAMIGAAVALLYAPQSGEKTRKQIVRKCEDVKDDASEFGDELLEKAEHFRERVAKRIDAGKDLVGEAKEKVMENIRGIEDRIKSLKKKIS
jgi:gas vesicle protein